MFHGGFTDRRASELSKIEDCAAAGPGLPAAPAATSTDDSHSAMAAAAGGGREAARGGRGAAPAQGRAANNQRCVCWCV